MAIQLHAGFNAATSGNITTANEPGISSTSGTVPTFTGTHNRFGVGGMLSASAVSSVVKQNFTSAIGRGFWRGYVRRVGTNSANAIFSSAQDSAATTIAGALMNASGNIVIRNGASAVATSTYAVAVNEWVRVEWDVNRAASTQTMYIYAGANIETSTATETISGACTAGLSVITLMLAGLVAASASAQFAFDEVAIGDSLIGPYVPPAPAYSFTVWNGTTELPATMKVWNGTSEVAASVDSIA